MAPLDLSEAKMGEDYAMYMKDHAMATVFCPDKRTAGFFAKYRGIWCFEILLMEEILHISNSSLYLQGLIHPRWCRNFSICVMFIPIFANNPI